MKDKGNQSFKSCGLWLPVGVTWSGFACGAARAAGVGGTAVHVGSGGFSEVFQLLAEVFQQRDIPFACPLYLPQLHFGM